MNHQAIKLHLAASLVLILLLSGCGVRTVEVTKIVVVTSTARPTSTFTPSPTPFPTPTPTYTAVPTSTPIPLPNSPNIFRPNISLGSRILIWITLSILGFLLFVVIRQAFYKPGRGWGFPPLGPEIDVFSVPLGTAFTFFAIGIATLVLVQNWLIASLFLVGAWLIPSNHLYPGLVTHSVKNWFVRNLFYILFGFLYLIAWIGFQTVAITGSVAGTIAIYFVGIVFYLMVKYRIPLIHSALKSRARDDLFLLILILFVFMAVLYSGSYYSAATLAGTVIDELYWKIYGWGLASPLRDFLQTGRDVFYSIYSTLANAAVVEVYGYGATLLVWTLNHMRKEKKETEGDSLSARVSGQYFLITLCILSAATILYCFIRFVIDYDASIGAANLLIGLVYGIPALVAGIVFYQVGNELEGKRRDSISGATEPATKAVQ